MKEKFINQFCLISLQDWFYAPDGQTYKAVWGKLYNISKVDDLLGFAPNRPNVNWIFEIGNIIIYGCQVKIIVLSPNKPQTESTIGWSADAANGLKKYETPTHIYISE